MTRSKNKTCAIVVGAGAVKNAWAPVLRALQPYHDFPLTPDGANSFLARLIYLLRWWAAHNSELGRREVEKHVAFLKKIRGSISNELKVAQQNKEIIARDEFENIVNRFLIPYSSRFMLVTTNWDNVIGSALQAHISRDFYCLVRPLHSHGSADNPDTLYLPTEVTKEPYRSFEEQQHIGGLHGSIWRGLEEAHRVLVYGLSISPLDAELGQTLACGWSNKNLKEIVIVSPDHEEVAHRVNLLLDRRRDIEVKGFSPDKLGIEHNYSIRRHKAKVRRR
ncbi:MAG: hypothetical protein ABI865_09025 [Nitrosospira sp.]